MIEIRALKGASDRMRGASNATTRLQDIAECFYYTGKFRMLSISHAGEPKMGGESVEIVYLTGPVRRSAPQTERYLVLIVSADGSPLELEDAVTVLKGR
jgi:hypothetical protein